MIGSVLRAAGDVNGAVASSHFQVVLVGKDKGGKQAIASVYSSDTGNWGDLISTPCPSMIPLVAPGVLVGGSVCWLIFEWSRSVGALEFDLDRQRLAVIEMPEGMSGCHITIVPAKGGGLGFLCLSSFRLESWKRKTDVDSGWVLVSTVELDKLLSLSWDGQTKLSIYGYVDGSNELLLTTYDTIFVIQLDSMKFKKSFGIFRPNCGHPFSCVYVPGI
ncbi:hypothetical protein PR202_gb06754 [Eleusine coracana subsp. coracana]|uniref:Uncharacterized protein n=1 Tax=Eleusine coracana subsp. coracana TaxID=191504 RepID=A0AAV5EAG1_ELECO|nr:hypothetical protein PR202_gb06754 [Eleusine coracana subsp. coracana]